MLSKNKILQTTNNMASLKVEAVIVLHSRLTQKLFNQSWQYGEMGLLQFSTLTSTLWKAAKKDDPYADYFLLKTYYALVDTEQKIKSLELHYTDMLLKIRGIEASTALNTVPVRCSIKFSNFFGYKGASLLADADYVMRQLLTLKYLGRFDQKHRMPINQLVKYLQDVFSVPRRWQQTNVTRKDFQENNDKAQAAIKLLGGLPEAILKHKIDFELASQYQGLINDDNINERATALHQ